MNVQSMLPILWVSLFTILFCFICYLIAKKTQFIQLEMNHKHPYLDALRGLAAFIVVIGHSSYIYNYWTQGRWGSPFEGYTQNVMQGIGASAVPIFFMLTSFLFFEKYLFAPQKFDLNNFYKKRFFRLTPMYFISVVFIFLAYLIFYTGYNISFDVILRSILSWLSFGYFRGITLNPGIGGDLINAGVFWTLIIEWRFYILFPLILALLFCLKRTVIYIITLFLVMYALYKVGLIQQDQAALTNYFSIGLISVLFYKFKNKKVDKILKSPVLAILSLFLTAYFVYFEQNGYGLKMNFMHGLFFILASNGNSFLGILKSKVLSFMGVISYSVYLLHGTFLSLIQYKFLRGYDFVTLTCVSMSIIVVISMFTYKFIELPCIQKAQQN